MGGGFWKRYRADSTYVIETARGAVIVHAIQRTGRLGRTVLHTAVLGIYEAVGGEVRKYDVPWTSSKAL